MSAIDRLVVECCHGALQQYNAADTDQAQSDAQIKSRASVYLQVGPCNVDIDSKHKAYSAASGTRINRLWLTSEAMQLFCVPHTLANFYSRRDPLIERLSSQLTGRLASQFAIHKLMISFYCETHQKSTLPIERARWIREQIVRVINENLICVRRFT